MKALNWGPWIGAAQLALGRGEGITRFSSTTEGFLASLAPWIAFPLVFAALAFLSGEALTAVTFMFMILVLQLTPPVLSHALAKWWGREEEWLRYATAYNWCQWTVGIASVAMLLVTSIAIGSGLSQSVGVNLFLVGVSGFSLWLSWSLARHGLGLSRLRAGLLVAVVNSVTVALLIGPQLLFGSALLDVAPVG